MTLEEAIKYGIEWLKDEYLDAKDGAFIKIVLEALEQEPCEDAVSRQEILDYLDKMPSELTSDGRRMVRRRTLGEYILDTLPPVTPQPKIGHWIGRDASGTNFYGKCSCCGQEIQIDAWYTQNMNYCPNCGSKMVDPQERNNKE